eukprot:g2522.t1
MQYNMGPPMLEPVMLGLESEVLKLLFHNATPAQRRENLRAPLQHARACGRLDLVAALLQAGADGGHAPDAPPFAAPNVPPCVAADATPYAAWPEPPTIQRSELYMATRAGDQNRAWEMMLQGADVNAWDPIEGMCILHAAVYGNHEQIAKGLLVRGADPNTRVIWDRTLLHVAALGGRNEIMKAMLANGGDKDAKDDFGETPLTKACHLGRKAVVETLMGVGCDVNVRGTGPARYTPLDRAAQNGHVSILRALIRRGGKVNSADDRGCTAMHVAAYHGELGSVQALIEEGGRIDTTNAYEWTPLLFAASSCSYTVMLTLLKHGAAVNVQSRRGTTPLHQACFGPRRGMEAAVKLLLQWGADKTILDKKNRTAADMIDSKLPDGEATCSQEEVDRVRQLLLSSGPSADNVWGRRSWLVMLRSRTAKAERASGDWGSNAPNGDDDFGGAAESNLHITGRKVPRDEGAEDEERCTRARVGDGADVAGTAGGVEGLRGVVWWLAGVEREDVFRAVVKFL